MSGHSTSRSVSSGVVGITSTAELGSLLEIENDPILRLQLKNWEEQAKSISRRIERKENRTYAVKNEVYQLLGFYLVFQGVVLTAVAQASVLTCEEWWSPFILSSMTSIVAIVGVYQKLQSLHDVEENLREEKNFILGADQKHPTLQEKGKELRFCDGCEERGTTQWDGCIIIIKNTKLFIQECSFAALVCGFQSQLCCVLVPGCVLRCGHHLLQHNLVQGSRWANPARLIWLYIWNNLLDNFHKFCILLTKGK